MELRLVQSGYAPDAAIIDCKIPCRRIQSCSSVHVNVMLCSNASAEANLQREVVIEVSSAAFYLEVASLPASNILKAVIQQRYGLGS